MAHNVSNEYKQVIYSQQAKNKIKILFNNVELQDADRYCEKLTVKSRIIPNGAKTFSLNNFISKEAELILHDIDTSIIQDQVSISIGTLVGNSYEYVPIGIFNIQDTPTNDKNKTTIKLRDNSVKFDFNYNAKPLIDSGGGTATKLQILQDICSKAGVTCNISSFIGSTDRVGIYDNTITARQYIADLAEQAGRIATINRSGELIFVNINDLTTWNIPLSIVERYELGKAYRIGKVVYEDGVRKYETASTTYDTLFLDASNPYVSSQAQVNSILQQVNAFEIDSVKTGKILGNPAIDGYDLINIYNDKVEGNPSIFKTLATNDLTYTGVLINTFDTQIGEDDREQNVSILGEATFKKWAKTEIDNINGEITLQAGKITTLEESIEVYSVDLDIYNITIPVDTNNKPLETKTYQIGYYAYYKGQQVTPTVTPLTTASGITQNVANNKINLSVNANTIITNLTNELSYRFNYVAEGETNSITKKIVVVLSQKGQQGIQGETGAKGDKGDKGEQGEKGEKGETGPKGEQGIQGVAGADGTSTYFYVRYSANASGNPMTTTPQSDTQYMGVASTTSSTAPTSYSAYTWSKTKGEQGQQGVQGQAGADGRSSYLHIKYSEDGTTFTPAQEGYPIGKKPSRWQGTYVDFNATDSNTFSDYNWVDTAIMVEDLLTPTNNASGTWITTNDSADADLLYFEMEGKTTQATREGYNLVPISDQFKAGSAAANITPSVNSNGELQVVVTASNGNWHTNWWASNQSFTNIENTLATGDTFTIVFTIKKSSDSNGGKPTIYIKSGMGYYTMTGTVGTEYSELYYTGTWNDTNGIAFHLGWGSCVGTYTIKNWMLKKGTYKSYEPYGVQPSPDYPSELVSVGYENLFNIEAWVNSGNNSNYYSYENGKLKINSLDARGFNNFNANEKIILPNGTYTISGYNANGLRIYNNGTDYPLVNQPTFEVTLGYVYLKFVSSTVVVCQPMIEKGNQSHSYIPYGKYGIEIETKNSNLIGLDTKQYKVDMLQGQKITAKNTTSTALTLNLYTNYGDTTRNDYWSVGANSTRTITLAHNIGAMAWTSNVASDGVAWINKGTSILEYEEHKENTYLYTLDNPLRSIGNIKDLLYIKNGMLYVERKIGSVVFKGTETWNLYSSNTVRTIFYTPISQQMESYTLTTDIPKLMSSHFIPASQNATWKNGDISRKTNENNIYLIVANGYTIGTFKTWLSTHNTEVQYILGTAVVEELGRIEIPSTYKPMSNISNTDELNPNMSIIYVRDLPLTNYVESHYAELKINENSIESRVTSIENNDYGDRISAVETKQTSTDLTIGVITQNSGIELTYDSEGKPVSGKVTEVTTTTGFTFNAEGMTISNSDTNFIAQHTNEGTFYKDGNTIVGQYTKDGSKQKDLQLFGVYYYGMEDKDDTPMFVAQLFTDENNEIGVGHFYNRGD